MTKRSRRTHSPAFKAKVALTLAGAPIRISAGAAASRATLSAPDKQIRQSGASRASNNLARRQT